MESFSVTYVGELDPLTPSHCPLFYNLSGKPFNLSVRHPSHPLFYSIFSNRSMIFFNYNF